LSTGLIGVNMSADRSLLVLFGSQSGNAEDMADQIGKAASKYNLEATVKGMDEVKIADLTNYSRILITCSTWGEGEQPDNAEDLWLDAEADDSPSMAKCNFSVLALGDSSYEFYCESGKQWDGWLESKGATRVYQRVDCDVEYEEPAASWLTEALACMGAVDDAGVFQAAEVDAMKNAASGSSSASISSATESAIPAVELSTDPDLKSESMQVEVSIFRYDPTTSSTGKDTWVCAFPGYISALEMLRTLKNTQDGSLTFRDGTADDPSTAISINGRYILPGNCRIDSLAPIRNGGIRIRIEPLPGFEVIRDLVVDTWPLEQNREISEPWMVAATRTGANTPQGPIGTMDSQIADKLHSISSFHSAEILHASSDATPHSNTYLGPSVVLQSWARLNDPRSSASKRAALQMVLDGEGGIKSETDLASIRRQGKTTIIHDSLLECKIATLSRDGYGGRHGKHVWWYTLSVKSSGRVNDTMIFRQVLGPIGLMGNLFSGVTARMALGFTRTGGSMFYDMLALVAPPAGLGKMPKQFNASVDKHHEVVAIFNEMDGRF
jgi:flavodoxin/succinate dehydrogenase/fumarate reductase-like Fe-S protein